MKLKDIDKMPSSKEKLRLWIQYGKKNDCIHEMTEIEELYISLKNKNLISREEFNSFLNQ